MAEESKQRRTALDVYLTAQQVAFAPLMFQAARAARDMGVLAALDDASAPLTPAEVAAQAKVSLYAARVLLEACLSMGLASLQDGRYRIERPGRVLLHDELTRANMDFVNDVCYRGAFHLEEALREGRPAGLKVFGDWSTIYEGLTRLPPEVQKSWFAFDHFYSDGVFPEACAELGRRGVRRLLDVGGNTGRFAVLCASQIPGVQVTILDHPGQLGLARANAEEKGVGAQVEGVPMDLLDHSRPFPTGFDAVWMSQFLDCFPERDIVQLLRRGREALAEGGRLYVNETCWDRQPHEVGRYCLHGTSLYFTAMANGTSRMYHSDDLKALIAEAGLVLEDDRALGIAHTLFVCRR